MRRILTALSAIATAVLLALPVSAFGQAPPRQPPTQFAIKADQGLARRINPLLGEIARPVTVTVPAGADPHAYIDAICGPNHPTWSLVVPSPADAPLQPGEKRVILKPCLQVDPTQVTVVRPGENSSAVKSKSGFLPKSNAGFAVVRDGRNLPITSTTLQPGDVIKTPPKPVWTEIETATPLEAGRAGLMAQIAARLACLAGESPAACLRRFNVLVMDNTPLKAVAAPKAVRPVTPADISGVADDGQPRFFYQPADEPPVLPPPPLPPGPPPPLQSAESAVAAGQWPYDLSVVRAILNARPASATSSRVAVIDLGLLNDKGEPLPPESFEVSTVDATRRRMGGGPPYIGNPSGVGMCSGSLARSAVTGEDLHHGAVTASLAGGLALRRQGAPASVLPNLLFYRLYGAPCPPSGGADVRPTDVVEAFNAALALPIVNLSYGGSRAQDTGLADSLKSVYDSVNSVLVVAAGNEGADLAENPAASCPACFATPSYLAEADGYLVLAVGAADDRLRREDTSNFGSGVVKLYAPGRPYGAVDLFGDDASRYPASTSYAAPQVAMALALMRSLTRGRSGEELDRRRLIDRILVSTWPLLTETGEVSPNAGVLDLTKALAVNNYAVGVRHREDGRLVRRTFVGDIPGGLAGLKICDATSFSQAAFQAVRLVGQDVNGLRTVKLYAQNRGRNQPKGRELVTTHPTDCTVGGSFRMNTLPSGSADISMADVEIILAPFDY